MTFDLFSNILSLGSSVPVPAVAGESPVGADSRDLGWDDRSVISAKFRGEDLV